MTYQPKKQKNIVCVSLGSKSVSVVTSWSHVYQQQYKWCSRKPAELKGFGVMQ